MTSWGTAFRPVSVAGRRQVYLLIVLGAAFIIGVVALSAWQLWRSRADALTDGIRDSRNITAVLGVHTSRIIKSIALVLTEISGEESLGISGRGLDRLEAHALLKRYLGAAPMVRSFFVIDEDGFLVVDSGSPRPERIDSSDREYFTAVKNMSNPRLHVGKPIKSRVVGTWFVPMSLRLLGPDGEFAGAVVAGVELSYFQDLFATIETGPGGSIALLHRDGDLLLRSPMLPDAVGRQFKDIFLFQHALLNSPSGSYETESTLDGASRLFSYQAIADTPLIVTVGLARDDVLESWRSNLEAYAAVTAAFCAAIGLLIVLLVRNQLRRDELAAAALRSSRRFRSIFDGSVDGLIAMDHAGRILMMNQASARMFACDASQMVGQSVSQLMPELHFSARDGHLKDRSGNKIAQAAGSGRELEGRALNGATVPLDLTISEIVEDGRSIFIGALRDLTERNKTAAALREIEERFQVLAESINVVPYSFRVGVRGWLDYVGPQVEAMLGYPAPDWTQQNFWREHVHPEDIEAILAQEHKLVPTGENYELEYRMIAADGRTVWIRDIVRMSNPADGGKVGFGVLVDISDIKQRDRQLAQAQKMEAIGQLTGGVAHDFNNLLTVIVGNAEALVDNAGDNEQMRRAAEVTLAAALRSADLVQRLLAFARQQTLRPTEVDVNLLVSSMNELLRRSLGEDIDVQIVLSGEPCCAIADPSQIEAAILNLAINARDAMPNGGKLVIETANTALGEDDVEDSADVVPGRYVMIAVTDSGAGMPPHVQARAFEPFFTTKEVGKGTGLGLSMVFGFARQSGGHAKIASEMGRGTTVKIYLPSVKSKAVKAGRADLSDSFHPRGSERILVVEDDPLVRDFVVGQLADLGYETLSVSNGPEAMKILTTGEAVDLLFSDIVMPGGINGRELAQQALRLRPQLKILLTSGYSEKSAASHDGVSVMLSILSKPYGRKQLASAIRGALDRSGVVDAAASPQ